ncbi:putative ribonuclease H-like domain-containing protein [Tanacetum coccineum]
MNGKMTQKLGLGFGFTKKACFVCGSYSHLIKDCDFHEKRMANKSVLKDTGKDNGHREVRPVWNNAQRINHQNKFVPSAVLTKFGRVPVSAAKQSSLRAAASTSAVKPVNIVTKRNQVNVLKSRTNTFHKSHSPVRRLFYKSTAPNTRISNEKVNAVRVNGVNTVGQAAVSAVEGKGVTAVKASAGCVWRPKVTNLNHVSKDNSGSWISKRVNYIDPPCRLKHMTWNKDFLTDYQDIDGGFVAFGAGTRGARTMLADLLLPTIFWAEAVNTACYVLNRVLVTKPHNKTPYELIIDRPSSISFMRLFGCPVIILNTLDPLGKFDGKADEGFLVRYSVNSKAFKVFNTETRKVEENLHVNFLENKPNVAGQGPNWLFDIDSLTNSINYQPVTTGNQTDKNEGPQETNGDTGLKKNVDAGQSEEENSSDEKDKDDTTDDAAEKEATNQSDVVRKEFEAQCNRQLLQRNATRASITNSFNTVSTPVNAASASRTFGDVGPSFIPLGGSFPIDRLISTTWNLPLLSVLFPQLEYTLFILKIQKVWTLVDLPYGKKAIGTKWVYRNKKDERGIVVRNKARLMDVKSAFLYGTIEDEVYVSQPLGFVDPKFPEKVYKVEKALYGLHQALRAWYETLSTYLLDNGFHKGQIDKTLFIKRVKGDILLLEGKHDDQLVNTDGLSFLYLKKLCIAGTLFYTAKLGYTD